jgi:hypothetical protein
MKMKPQELKLHQPNACATKGLKSAATLSKKKQMKVKRQRHEMSRNHRNREKSSNGNQ